MPGGVQVTAVTVTGGYSTPPELASPATSNGGFGPIPKLVVSSFQVNYTVENCGSGMTLLEGSYDQSDSSDMIDQSDVIVERIQAGTPGITGTFDLSFNGREIRGLSADISASLLDQLLEANFPDEGGTIYGFITLM